MFLEIFMFIHSVTECGIFALKVEDCLQSSWAQIAQVEHTRTEISIASVTLYIMFYAKNAAILQSHIDESKEEKADLKEHYKF